MRLTNAQAEQRERYDVAMKIADNRQALDQWAGVLRERKQDQSPGEVVLASMVEMLGPVLEYLASRGNPSAMGMRAWCLFYAVRPDLIDHETFAAGAARFGVSQENMIYHFAKLKKAVPGYAFVKRSTPTTEVLHKRMIKANAGRVRQQKEAKALSWAARHQERAA